MKKIYILALTFLGILSGQLGYGQALTSGEGGYNDYDTNANIARSLFPPDANGISHLDDVIVRVRQNGQYYYTSFIFSSYWSPNDSFDIDYSCDYCLTVTGGGGFGDTSIPCPTPIYPPGYRVDGCACTVNTWYLDYDGDGYYSNSYDSVISPGNKWSLNTNGYDCDDTRPQYTTECCTTTCSSGFILNPDTCECVKKPCDEAKVADHIYNTINGIQEAGKTELNDYGNMHLVSPAGLPSEFNSPDFKWSDPVTGFSSALYSVDHGNGNIELIYATAGTDDFNDVINDAQQALGAVSKQYYQSVKNAGILATWAANNGYTLSFTGHSLGGGLANANALATGLPATIYNPAGLSNATVNDPNLNLNLNYSSKVTAYIVRGEPVDYLNTKLGTPVRGTRNYIGSPQDTNSLYGTLSNLTIAGLISTVQLHLMSSVISNLDCNH